MKKRHGLAIAGGTFDHFHAGHEKFLLAAFGAADRVTVGITSDRMAKAKPFAAGIEPFFARKDSVIRFLSKKGLLHRASIAKIHNPLGPAFLWERADAILATKDTLAGARKINAKRKKRGMPPAKIIACPLAVAVDGARISSEGIRLGRMDRKGRVFLFGRKFSRTLAMPASLASTLRKPSGKLFLEPNAAAKAKAFLRKQKPVLVATVGDATFRSLSALGVRPNLAVVDTFELRSSCGLCARLPAKRLVVSNPAGKITSSLVFAIKRAVAAALASGVPAAIVVRGEEDLAAIPAILSLPLGSVVLYGQPKKGIVAVVVDERAKERAFRTLSRFKKQA
jgi:cytidyltransferase-like protein